MQISLDTTTRLLPFKEYITWSQSWWQSHCMMLHGWVWRWILLWSTVCCLVPRLCYCKIRREPEDKGYTPDYMLKWCLVSLLLQQEGQLCVQHCLNNLLQGKDYWKLCCSLIPRPSQSHSQTFPVSFPDQHGTNNWESGNKTKAFPASDSCILQIAPISEQNLNCSFIGWQSFNWIKARSLFTRTRCRVKQLSSLALKKEFWWSSSYTMSCIGGTLAGWWGLGTRLKYATHPVSK